MGKCLPVNAQASEQTLLSGPPAFSNQTGNTIWNLESQRKAARSNENIGKFTRVIFLIPRQQKNQIHNNKPPLLQV